jgi:hypothetical protein
MVGKKFKKSLFLAKCLELFKTEDVVLPDYHEI